jgi:hypothetical protein
MFKISTWTIRKLEQGGLRRYNASRVGYKAKIAGPPVQHVYELDQLRKLINKGDDASFAAKNREAEALELLFQGKNAAEIARRTKLRLKDVQALRDAYAAETKGVFLQAFIIEELEKLGCPAKTPEDVVIAFANLLRRVRELQRVPPPAPASSSPENEQGRLVIPAHLVKELEKMGFPTQSAEAFVGALALLFEHIRGKA